MPTTLLVVQTGLHRARRTRGDDAAELGAHAAIVVAAVGVAVLANVALTLNDAHFDLTREKIYTPSAQAMKVVDDLTQPVRLTYFYRSQDPEGRRVKEVLGVMPAST